MAQGENVIKVKLEELEEWFKGYDTEVNKYLREKRVFGTSSIDIQKLDQEAETNRDKIKSLRKELGI